MTTYQIWEDEDEDPVLVEKDNVDHGAAIGITTLTLLHEFDCDTRDEARAKYQTLMGFDPPMNAAAEELEKAEDVAFGGGTFNPDSHLLKKDEKGKGFQTCDICSCETNSFYRFKRKGEDEPNYVCTDCSDAIEEAIFNGDMEDDDDG